MPSTPPPAWLVRCPRNLAVALCATVLVSTMALSNVAAARPIAYPAQRGKACKHRARTASAAMLASIRRADARRRVSIARYGAGISGLRRAGASRHRHTIEHDRLAIARLRSRLYCQTRHPPRSEANQRWGPLDPNRTQITSDADRTLFQQWVDAASRAGVPTPVGSVQVVNAPCPTAAASSCTNVNGPIYLDPAEPDRADVFYHELGHQLWYQMGAAQRDEFMTIIGKAGQPYRQPGGNSPHEQWAEAYRVVVTVALHGPKTDKGAAYGLVVDDRRLAALTALVKRIDRYTTQPSA